MTQDNTPIDPSIPPAQPESSASKTPQAPPKKKRRWLRRVVLAGVVIIVLLLILVGLAPTLLSTGAGRTFVLGKINENLNGHVAIASWSIGWTSGIHAEDVKVFDDQNGQILQIPHFTTHLSLLAAARGEFHLGDTRIEGLDFFVHRFSDGSTNFDRLVKSKSASKEPEKVAAKESEPAPKERESAPAKPAEPPAKQPEVASAKQPEPAGKKIKLPVVDGELQLIGCRGTFQDDANPDLKARTIDLRTITADVKIPSINGDIENKANIIAYGSDGAKIAELSTSGKMLIAKDNELLTPGQMQISQTLATSGDLKQLQPILATLTPLPVQFTSGTIDAKLDFSNGSDGITIAPLIKGDKIAYTKDGVAGNFGGLYVDGKANMAATSAGKEAVTNVTFTKLRAMLLGGAVVIDGPINDVERQRNFNNVTLDWTYNLAMLLDAYKPFESPDQKKSLKDLTIAGNKTEHFVISGSLPADKPTNEALASLNVTGEFAIDSLEAKGASLKNFVLPISLAGGKIRIAYAGKSGDQQYAPPAELNGGKFSLAGATYDLAARHPTLTIPDGTRILDNVSSNPVFAQTILAGWLSNPAFSNADKASGSIFATVNHCVDLPVDNLVLENVPENKGVIDLNLQMTHVELGSKLVNSLNSALAIVNPKGKIASGGLLMTIPSLAVHIQHGITHEDMKLEIGKNPPMQLTGDVVMKTNMIQQMAFAIPITKEQSIKLPVTGAVEDPKLDTAGLLKQNLINIPGVPKDLKGILGGDKNADTQPSDKKDKGIGDIIGNVLKPKEKSKDGQ